MKKSSRFLSLLLVFLLVSALVLAGLRRHGIGYPSVRAGRSDGGNNRVRLRALPAAGGTVQLPRHIQRGWRC